MNFFKVLLSTVITLSTCISAAQTNQAYFTLQPTLTPNAKFIIFSYESDLWKVPTNGGIATRITAMDGNESNPSVSPNGKWLAFSSTQYGNSDVYVMPIEGGEIKQLTFNDSFDTVSSWGWDNETIYFNSGRNNSVATYTINIKGGTPTQLFNHYFNTVHNAVEDTEANIYFNESWESFRFAHRKRYKGDYNPDIKSYNPKTKVYKQHTTYNGKDFGATIAQNNTIYFKSDEANGEYNLYRLKDGEKKQLTNFSTSIMWPKVSANGEKVVFRKDYQIFVYDVASGKTLKPNIVVNTNNTLAKTLAFNTKDKITYFDVSSDEKKIAFVSRGRLFVSDIEGKFIQQINTTPTEAVKEVKWLKNNKTLLFTQTYNGYYNLFIIDAATNSNQKQLSKINENHRNLALNSNANKAVYLKGRNHICILNLANFKSEVVVNDELWAIHNATPQFSPNGEYITYNAYRDFETDVFVYNLKTKETQNLTTTKVTESSPVWSPNGKYIYFASDRENPSYPFGTSNAKIYQMALDRYSKPFKVNEINALFEEDKKDNDEKDDKKVAEAIKPIHINTTNIMQRLTLVSPEFGQQGNPSVIQQKEKTYILYTSNHSEGKSQLWKTTLEDFEKPKMERIDDKVIRNYQLDKGKKNYYILTSGTIHNFDVASNKLKAITTSFKFNKTYANEFEQMYYEAWAGMEENFYNEDFHGQNWQKLRDEYAKYIPYVTSRAQLRLILNDMLGELNTSHFGFNSSGNEEKTFYGNKTLATGIVFSNCEPFTVERIISNSPVDVKGNLITKGDILVKVNGIMVNKNVNREHYFTSATSTEELTLTFKGKDKNYDVNIHPISTNSKKTLLYNEWQHHNQRYVDENSNNQIAYVHMKNMTNYELEKFKHDLVGEEAYKKGLILDLRYNTGGNVHDEVLKFLSQKTYLHWKYREGKKTGQSNFGYGDKPIVLLINEQSLSDAEMTAAGFKQLGLGTIVGTETYRWIIFTSGKSLVDGSYYRLPSWGCYTLSGDNLEHTGVKPDIYINKNFTDRLQNNHPQLDKAIEIIMKQL